MNKAISQLPITEDKQPKKKAIIIPLHPEEKEMPKKYRKKMVVVKTEPVEAPDAPVVHNFTAPVFRPKKHDLL